MEKSIEKIKQYVLKLKPDFKNIDFEVEEMVDRVILYTKMTAIPLELERILAKTIVSLAKDKEYLSSEETGEISSVSDNGQSISFKDKSKSRTIRETDLDILDGIREILDKYRKVEVFRENEITK